MARKSLRLSIAAETKGSPGHKRIVSTSASTGTTAKRYKKLNPSESRSATAYCDENDGSADDEVRSMDAVSHESDGSAYLELSGDSVSSEAEAYESDSQSDRPRKANRIKAQKRAMPASESVEQEDGGLRMPGVQVVIKKPKPRPAGNTPYQDDTLHPNTMLFLQELKANNQRQWLKLHDAPFRQAEGDWHSFVDRLTARLTEIDDTVPELPVKDVIFRIYRDVRFSSDPTPYKAHFSAAWSRTGRKGPYAHYYVQVAPNGGSFVGGGLWHPDALPTAAIRRDIDRHPRRLKDVLTSAGVRKEFLGGVARDDVKAVKAFVSANSSNALKMKPKGFDAKHPDIELLRLKNYTIGTKLSEADVTGLDGLELFARYFATMKPFITYLNSVVMPDDDDDDGEVEEDAEDSEDDEGGDEIGDTDE